LPKYVPQVGRGLHAEHVGGTWADRPLLPAAGMGKSAKGR
jgi:hypothetical protein